MASPKKISELTTAGPLTGAELVPVVQNSGTLQTTVSVLKLFIAGNIENEVSALDARVVAVSTLATQNAAAIASVQTDLGNLTTRVDNVSASVSSLNVRMSAAEASISAINSVLAAIDVSALAVLEPRVSALEIRVALVSAAVSVNAAAITSLNVVVADVSARTSGNAAAITSINNAVSAQGVRLDVVSAAAVSLAFATSILETRVSAVSAAIAPLSLAITSVNAVVSALEVRVSAVSATGVANTASIVSINGVVSAITSQVGVLDTRITAVSASVSTLNIQMVAVQASISAINSVLANINASALAAIEPRVSALEIRMDAVSAAITSVNAVVSTKANRNGDFLTNVQYIGFNTTTSYAPAPGRLTWDIPSGTLDLGLTGTVNLLIGQRTVAQVYNNSGVTLPKGKAVRVTGAQGQRLTGALAQADSDADSITIFGIMLETVSVNNSGYVATDGLVRNLDTRGFSDGDIVYLSPVSAGELTPTKPVAPQHLVQIGYIVNGGTAGAGEIYVKVQNGYELGELHDVKTSTSTSLATGEVLAWDTSAGVWTNSTALINVQASVSALNVQVAAVSASVSVINARLPAGTVVGTTDTQTLTNKRINPRVFTTTTGVSLTPDISQFEIYAYTALASDLTINAAASGTPVDGNRLIFRIEDNGVSRNLTWATAGTNSYRQVGATLPTTTSAGRVTYVGCLYNQAELFWDVLAVATQA
jgi:hypothetical protein